MWNHKHPLVSEVQYHIYIVVTFKSNSGDNRRKVWSIKVGELVLYFHSISLESVLIYVFAILPGFKGSKLTKLSAGFAKYGGIFHILYV